MALDPTKLDRQRDIAVSVVTDLASAAVTPVWNAAAPLATYDDAVTIHGILETGLADLGRFTAAQQTTLLDTEAALQAIVDAGPAGFDATATGTLLGSSLTLVGLLASGDCDGFVE
ncbi:MAG: hypothetical protein R2695_12420 [Acidimicrobiales bacterium]